jgi:hypothetical protein
MQNSTMSLPNRSHSVTEMPTATTTNGDQHHRRLGLIHSNSTANNSLLYQRSSSYIKTINENNNNNFESTINGDNLFRTDKFNIVNNNFFDQFFF